MGNQRYPSSPERRIFFGTRNLGTELGRKGAMNDRNINAEDCKKFESCSAPLCPWDASSLEHGLWYPDEDICNFQQANQLDWVRRQRKIAKKIENKLSFFTHKMLCQECRVTSAIKGLNPDKDRDKQEEDWLIKHPALTKRIITPEKQKRMRQGRLAS